MKQPKLIDKQVLKRSEGRCYLCFEDDYSLLDVHRIVEGQDGGRYTNHNAVVLCANCHRRHHHGDLTIHRWYQGTGGRVLHYTEDGEEKWK